MRMEESSHYLLKPFSLFFLKFSVLMQCFKMCKKQGDGNSYTTGACQRNSLQVRNAFSHAGDASDDVTMGDHDSFRNACRAAGVHDHCDIRRDRLPAGHHYCTQRNTHSHRFMLLWHSRQKCSKITILKEEKQTAKIFCTARTSQSKTKVINLPKLM